MNCNYNCRCCDNFTTAKIIYNDTEKNLTLEIPECCIKNGQKVCFAITCCMPSIPEEVCLSEIPVLICVKNKDGDITFQAQTEHGTYVYANKIKARRVYHFTVATDSKVFCCHDKCVQYNIEHQFPIL